MLLKANWFGCEDKLPESSRFVDVFPPTLGVPAVSTGGKKALNEQCNTLKGSLGFGG